MDFSSGKVRILSSTEKVNGEGPAFANRPRWSNDGQKLLMAFEVSGTITSLSGDALQWVDRPMPKKLTEGIVSPKGWWSSKEILFVWDPEQSGISKLFRLDLTTGQVSNAASFLPIAEKQSNDVVGVDVNSRYVLIEHQNRSELFKRSGELLQTWDAGARLRFFN